MGEDHEGSKNTASAGRPVRARPLVSPSAVRSWARRAGFEPGGVFEEVDPVVIDRYLAHLGIGPLDDQPPAPAHEGAQRLISSDPCPRCAGPGYLEHIDLRKELRTLRCRPCGQWWDAPLSLESEATTDAGAS